MDGAKGGAEGGPGRKVQQVRAWGSSVEEGVGRKERPESKDLAASSYHTLDTEVEKNGSVNACCRGEASLRKGALASTKTRQETKGYCPQLAYRPQQWDRNARILSSRPFSRDTQ